MPTIPPEGTYADAELHFIEAQPPGLWPENQDSIFGQFRKVICDILQGRKDEIEMLAQERFVPTSTRYLSLWEEMLGVTIAPTGKTTSQRRAVLETRLKWGAFSRPQRNAIIESFILPTMSGGLPAAFTPAGIPFGAGGIPLYGPGGLVTQKYRVYEDPVNFAYTVWIDSTNVPDVAALTRELSRITPAGIAFTIDTTHTLQGLIDWGRTVKNFAPTGWWKLAADYNDSSGLGFNGTEAGTPVATAIASPGLIVSAGSDAARDFGGSYVTIANATPLNPYFFTMAASVRPDSFPASGNYRRIYTASTNNFIGITSVSGAARFVMRISDGVTQVEAVGTSLPVAGTTYRIAGVWDGTMARLYVNGVEERSQSFVGPVVTSGGGKAIAGSLVGTELWDGGLDEVALFGRALSPAEILYISNQARNIL